MAKTDKTTAEMSENAKPVAVAAQLEREHNARERDGLEAIRRQQVRVECLKVASELRQVVSDPQAVLMLAQQLEAWVIGDPAAVPNGRDDLWSYRDPNLAEIPEGLNDDDG